MTERLPPAWVQSHRSGSTGAPTDWLVVPLTVQSLSIAAITGCITLGGGLENFSGDA